MTFFLLALLLVHVVFGIVVTPHLSAGWTVLVSQAALLGLMASRTRIQPILRWGSLIGFYFYFLYVLYLVPSILDPHIAPGRVAIVIAITVSISLAIKAMSVVISMISHFRSERDRKEVLTKCDIDRHHPQFTIQQLFGEVFGFATVLMLWRKSLLDAAWGMSVGQTCDYLMVCVVVGIQALSLYAFLSAAFDGMLCKSLLHFLFMLSAITSHWAVHYFIAFGYHGYGKFGGPDMLYGVVAITALLSLIPLKIARLIYAQNIDSSVPAR